MKEIHFYAFKCYDPWLQYSWDDTRAAIEDGRSTIHTLQMGFLSDSPRLFAMGYRIFVHESLDDVYEIKLGDGNERTNRTIREGHNLFKMWRAGEFDKTQQPTALKREAKHDVCRGD